MFNDLFHTVKTLDHDFREEQGKRVHAYGCHRCAIARKLRSFKDRIRQLLRDVDFELGDPVEERRKEEQNKVMQNSKDEDESTPIPQGQKQEPDIVDEASQLRFGSLPTLLRLT